MQRPDGEPRIGFEPIPEVRNVRALDLHRDSPLPEAYPQQTNYAATRWTYSCKLYRCARLRLVLPHRESS
jgi:hypothetical protein